jgi:tetratricopeptide (TPR) repeat protein
MDKAVIIDPAPEGVAPVGEDMMADALLRCGTKHYEAGDWATAAEMLATAEEKGKKTSDLYAALARAEAQRGETEAAFKAASKALNIDTGDVTLMREAAGWASGAKVPWMHHKFFAMAEKQKSIGLEFKPPAAINNGMEQKYKALNMVGDVLSTFLFEEEIGSREWDGLLEREALLQDMEKFLDKKPPKDFSSTDKDRLYWLVYHYWNVTGVVFFYMGDFERAKTWLGKAAEVAKTGKVKHKEIPKEELDKELTWAEGNLKLVL